MADTDATLLERFASIVGDAQVLSAAADIEPYLTDWRGRYHGAARAVVRPGSTAEVAAILRACSQTGTPVVPQGGNTGLCGGATPSAAGAAVVLSMRRMNRVRALDAANATITVEAGMPLASVHQAAAAGGMHFPLSLASEGSCTIGGNLATNAGGTAVLRFGNTRELTLGIEAVLADGSVLDGLRGLRKDNTGYDLKQLFIGAEGTLGVVTAAVLKVFALPRMRVTALVALASVADAVALLARLRAALSDRLVGFEIMSAFSLALSRRHHASAVDVLPEHPWYALVQADDSAEDSVLLAKVESALAGAIDSGVAADAAVARSDDQAQRLWALRENISEAQRKEGPNIKHDISLPVSVIPSFLDVCGRALLAAFPGTRLVVFGHLGDGNLHYNLSASEGVDTRRFIERSADVNRIVYDLVASHGGSFSAEHGVGQLKRDELTRYKSPVEMRLMRLVKAAFDPQGIMNPGKVL